LLDADLKILFANAFYRSKPISASESNLKDPSFSNYCKNDERLKVVIWPPPPPPTSSLLSGNNVCIRRKNIMDPERINEYKRQKEIEMEAIRRKERETMRLLQKQMQTSQIYRKERSGDKVESPFRNDNLLVKDAQFYGSNSDYRTINTSNIKNEPNPQVRVFETRPISAFSEDLSSQELMYSPSSQTWKRTYVVDTQSPIAKNEIISSRELLERERFDVDLLKLREAFIVKPELELEIHRTGRKWKPPPDPPYIWSTSRLSYNTDLEMLSSNTPIPVSSELSESEEYRWEPYKTDSNYKYERKDFVPDDVYLGPGSLDDVAKRQVKYLIPPSPDGTHRPKALFRGPRSTPSGGFCPRAPNSIKVSEKRLTDS
uniref:PEHE domain-containing protein n=1 Tax=Dracunculus medinensis TaxID=318479 RepID=A0A0N4U7L1_DRAME